MVMCARMAICISMFVVSVEITSASIVICMVMSIVKLVVMVMDMVINML